MSRHTISRRSAVVGASLAGTLALAMVAVPRALHAQHTEHPRGKAEGRFQIPESMKKEHSEIHGRLEAATKLTGATGEAARALAEVLHPHFVREEQIALPPLGLLAPLAEHRNMTGMDAVIPMTDSLRAELPRMLKEHQAIGAATQKMLQAAEAEGNAEVADLARTLALHAKSEEEIFYPAALVVGDMVRMHSQGMGKMRTTGHLHR